MYKRQGNVLIEIKSGKIKGNPTLWSWPVSYTHLYDFNGQIALCERFEYVAEATRDTEGVLKADFTLMKLEEGRNTLVSLVNKTTGEILYTANLVDDIIMFRGDSGEPPYSLECDHDFPITLKLKYEKETWTLVQATVLDWNVVSRPVELGADIISGQI